LTVYSASTGAFHWARIGVVIVILGGAVSLPIPSRAIAAPNSYRFTSADTERGKLVYTEQCAACHGDDLVGNGAPPLGGGVFRGNWIDSGRSYADLDGAIRQMPKQAPGSLSATDYLGVMAYILAANKMDAIGRVAAGAPTRASAVTAGPKEQAGTSSVLPASPPSHAKATTSAPAAEELLGESPSDWLMYNRTYKGDRFSPLSQINADNARHLQPVCTLQLGVQGAFQGSPLVYKGMGYVSSVYGVYAFDPVTCARKWTYTYSARGQEGFLTSRGLAIAAGKLFRGTSDGHLIALDAATGELIWDEHVADAAKGYGLGAAPVVYQGRVIIGLNGGDYGLPGHVYAFDARDGHKLWSFDTIDTKHWKKGAEYGGGASWTTVAVDPKDGLVFIPVGNPAPDFLRGVRPGDNLYCDSVVAVRAADGKVAWYVQQLAADYHDWDTAAAPILYEQGGRRFLAVGTKAGFLFIYDRDTHEQVARVSVVTRLNDELPFTETPLRVCPGAVSGVEWNGPAYDPASKLLFVNSVDWCSLYTKREPEGWKPRTQYLEAQIAMDPFDKARGWTRALDAATGTQRWARQAPMPMVGAVTPTAGGVLLTGGGDGHFLALDQRDGQVLYDFNVGAGISGGIATYMVGERQYVAVAAGGFGLLPYGVVGAPSVTVFGLLQTPP
jgi:alcohol dehydrogenase (cytochrome c)